MAKKRSDKAACNEETQIIMRLLKKRERLHPDLRSSVFDGMLKHPLWVEPMYREGTNELINYKYKLRKAAVAKARKAKDWAAYVFLHESPFRLQIMFDAFDETCGTYADQITDTDFWRVLGTAYTETEFPFNDNEEFTIPLLNSDRPGRIAIMDKDEQKAFKQLPETLTVYRGYAYENAEGWSWTLNREKAQWFATRFGDFEPMGDAEYAPFIAKGTVSKRDVIAYFTRRSEEEIVIDPLFVKGVSHKPIK